MSRSASVAPLGLGLAISPAAKSFQRARAILRPLLEPTSVAPPEPEPAPWSPPPLRPLDQELTRRLRELVSRSKAVTDDLEFLLARAEAGNRS